MLYCRTQNVGITPTQDYNTAESAHWYCVNHDDSFIYAFTVTCNISLSDVSVYQNKVQWIIVITRVFVSVTKLLLLFEVMFRR